MGVAIAIPVERQVSIHWAINLARLIAPISPNVHIIYRSGAVVDVLRNALVKDCLNINASHIFWLDSDVLPPPEAIPRLMSHKYPIVSGVYRSKTNAIGAWMLKGVVDGVKRYSPVSSIANQVVLADAVGAGCLLTDIRLFKRLPEPWFKWGILDLDKPGTSEDFYFCEKVFEHTGLKVLVDGHVLANHEGLARVNIHGGLEDWI